MPATQPSRRLQAGAARRQAWRRNVIDNAVDDLQSYVQKHAPNAPRAAHQAVADAIAKAGEKVKARFGALKAGGLPAG